MVLVAHGCLHLVLLDRPLHSFEPLLGGLRLSDLRTHLCDLRFEVLRHLVLRGHVEELLPGRHERTEPRFEAATFFLFRRFRRLGSELLRSPPRRWGAPGPPLEVLPPSRGLGAGTREALVPPSGRVASALSSTWARPVLAWAASIRTPASSSKGGGCWPAGRAVPSIAITTNGQAR